MASVPGHGVGSRRVRRARRRAACDAGALGRRGRVRGRSTTAITPRCWPSAAACSATVRTARTRCRRPSCAPTARCARAGCPTRCGPGCSRSRATAAARCSRPAATAAVPIDELEPGFDGLAEDVRRRAELRELVADLGRLPDDQREALVLFELGDLSHAEIAATIGCPTGQGQGARLSGAHDADRRARRARHAVRGDPRTARGRPRRRAAPRTAAPPRASMRALQGVAAGARRAARRPQAANLRDGRRVDPG